MKTILKSLDFWNAVLSVLCVIGAIFLGIPKDVILIGVGFSVGTFIYPLVKKLLSVLRSKI